MKKHFLITWAAKQWNEWPCKVVWLGSQAAALPSHRIDVDVTFVVVALSRVQVQ